MFVKIFSTAAFMILSWLTMVSTDIRSVMSSVAGTSISVGSSVTSHLETNSEENKDLIKQVNLRLDEIILSQNASEEQREMESNALVESKKKLSQKDGEIERIKNIVKLRDAYSIVLEAEVYSRAGNSKAAVESLLSSKKLIYGSSGKLPKSKDQLRKLMGPIDSLAAKWKKGDKSNSSLSIRKVLKSEINSNKI